MFFFGFIIIVGEEDMRDVDVIFVFIVENFYSFDCFGDSFVIMDENVVNIEGKYEMVGDCEIERRVDGRLGVIVGDVCF